MESVKRKKHDSRLGFYLTRTVTDESYSLTFSDLLNGDFSHCILTNYMIDLNWLLQQSDRLLDANVILVHGERSPESHSSLRDMCAALNPKIHVTQPPLPIQFGTHHSKMMVLFYPTGIRIVICTANFIPSDWENKTQGIWVKDFPLKTATAPTTSVFETDLITYLSSLGPSVEAQTQHVKRFDFSRANVHLVYSIPGYHKGQGIENSTNFGIFFNSRIDMKKFGHLRIKELLGTCDTDADSTLVAQFSSLGSISEKYLNEFTQSFQSKVSKLRIVWPTVNDVVSILHLLELFLQHIQRTSNEGWAAGRSIPCSSKNMKPFLRPHLCSWNPPDNLNRQRSMPHIKSYAKFSGSNLEWVLLTSANFSMAAWGTLQKKDSQLMIRSYEIGVLFTPELAKNSSTFSCTPNHMVLGYPSDTSDVTTFKSWEPNGHARGVLYFPLPYDLPPKGAYSSRDTPWVWDQPRTLMDDFGQRYTA